MVLHGSFYRKLGFQSSEKWRIETEKRIRKEAEEMVGEFSEGLVVEVEIKKQDLFERRMLITKDDAVAEYNMRRLQDSSPLQLDFNTNIRFSSLQTEWDQNEMVAAGFKTVPQQTQYLYLLKAADSNAFESVDRMTMTVEGDVITEEKTSEDMEVVLQDNSMWIIIGAAAGGVLLVLLAGIGGMKYSKSKKDDQHQNRHGGKQSVQSQMSPTSSQFQSTIVSHPQSRPPVQLSSSDGLPPPQAQGPQGLPAQLPPTQNYFGTIESREGEDDVSTLGDPYFGEGANNNKEPRADETVAESMISNEQGMYEFGVGRQRLMTGGSASLMQSTITEKSPNRHIFGDDGTLENAYLTPSASYDDGNNTSVSSYHRLAVIAPSGKLGIVVDNQTGDMPVVHAIKETSVLHEKVHVGDMLISVDEVECRGMSPTMVSKLIASRSGNAGRRLVLLRSFSSGGGGGSGGAC